MSINENKTELFALIVQCSSTGKATAFFNLFFTAAAEWPCAAYIFGLLAMAKCYICSYQINVSADIFPTGDLFVT